MILKQGSNGSEVSILQRQLASLGYNIPAIDGAFGNLCNEAVLKFQGDKGLTQDGIVGDNTFAILDSLVPILVDIYHGDTINWPKASKRVQGCLIKATQGNTDTDPHLAENIAGAKSIGALIWLYHFVSPGVSAQDQWDYYKAAVTAQGYTKFRPVFDVETNGITAEQVQGLITLSQAGTGLRPLVYITHSYLRDNLGGVVLDADLWIASWQLEKPPGEFLFWQWDDKTYPAGFGSCDIDAFMGTLAELQAYATIT